MAAGGPAAGHIAQHEGHHRAPVAGQDPVDRPGKGDGLRPPAHGLGEAQPQDKPRQELRQALGGGPAGGALLDRQVDAPGGVHFDEVGDRHALGPGEPRGRGRDIARGVHGHGLGRTDDFLGDFGLGLGHLPGHQRQAPGGAPGEDLPHPDAFGLQQLAERGNHFLQNRREKTGRDLFSADFQQQFFRHGDPRLEAVSFQLAAVSLGFI